jgi:hypothetical protein
MLQYRRQTTNAANGLPASSRPAASDFRNERMGMLGLNHQVGEPMQIRSNGPCAASGIRISPVAPRTCAGSMAKTSNTPCRKGKRENRSAYRLSVSSIAACRASQPRSLSTSAIASATLRDCPVYV